MGFALIAVSLLLTALGTIETIQWLVVRQAISLALLEAARAGSTRHADPYAMAAAFEQALRPLHVGPTPQATWQGLQAALTRKRARLQQPPWRIQVLHPGAAAFADFAVPGLPGLPGTDLPAIDNDHQALQHARNLARGWQQGRGPSSGLTIHEANTLALHLVYPHEPLLPLTRALLPLLAGASQDYAHHALRHGYLPLRQEIVVAMQSHPVAWASRPDTIVWEGASTCHGSSCHSTAAPGTLPEAHSPEGYAPDGAGAGHSGGEHPVWPGGSQADDADVLPDWAPADPELPQPPGTSGEAEGSTLPGEGDPACGVALCCQPAG